MAEKKDILGIPIGYWVLACILIVAVLYPYWSPYFIPAPEEEVKYKYTTGLTAKFKVMDDTTSALITANTKVEIFPTTLKAEDVYAKTFITKATTVASYDSALGAWTASLDAGSYNILVTDTQTTKTRYGTFESITVSGTDDEEKEVWCEPSTLHVVQRASETISKTIMAWNATAESYSISVNTLNYTLYTKWRVTFTFATAGELKYFKEGRIYFTEMTGLTPTKGYVDGVEASVLNDKDASPDSLVGYYVDHDKDWEGGEVHTIVIFFEKTGSPSAGTMTLTHADFYAVQRTALKWWTYGTTTVTVEA